MVDMPDRRPPRMHMRREARQAADLANCRQRRLIESVPRPPMMADNLALLRTLLPISLAEYLAYVTARAEFPVQVHVSECDRAVRPNRKIAYRLTLQGMQPASRPREELGPAIPLLLMHRTGYGQLMDVFGQKRIGGDGSGAYFWGREDGRWRSSRSHNMDRDAWLRHVVGAHEAALHHPANITGVIFECWAETPWKSGWISGQRLCPDEEQAECAEGWSLRLGGQRENRWCVPSEYVTIVAMWLLDSSLGTLPSEFLD